MKGAGLAIIDQVPHVLRLFIPLYTDSYLRATVGVPPWKNPHRLLVLRSPEQAIAV